MIYAVTLVHHNERQFKPSIERFYEALSGSLEIRHLVLWQHYPLQPRRDILEELQKRYNFELHDVGHNLGLKRGINHLLSKIDLQNDDFVLGYDADSYPVSPGYDMALRTCFLDAQVGWATLWGPWLDGQIKGHNRAISQIQVTETHYPIMNSVCMWRGSFLKHSGGIHELGDMYGGLELALWPHLQSYKGKWVFTRDWHEDHRLHWLQDEEYKRWKWYLAHERKVTGTFLEYVQRGCPIL